MLAVSSEDTMTNEQRARWEQMLKTLGLLNQGQSYDPWLFHGTSQASAAAILADGFDPARSWVTTRRDDGSHGGPKACVFWTIDIETARSFACRRFNGGFPVILVAKQSDVVASGTPFPDLNAWEIDSDEDPNLFTLDWRVSLQKFGSIAVLECRRVANIKYASVGNLAAKHQAICC